MPRLAILHTARASVEPLTAMAAEVLPDLEVVHIVDDTILPDFRQSGGNVAAVAGRMAGHAAEAARAGADVILNACSSVGEAVADERAAVNVPVVRIDEALAEAAVAHGGRIGVVMTADTTVGPTMRLLQSKADAAGQSVSLKPVLVAGAFERIVSGDREGHDALLKAAIEALVSDVDVIVLAQSTMARIIPSLPAEVQGRVLSSPRLALEAVRAALGS